MKIKEICLALLLFTIPIKANAESVPNTYSLLNSCRLENNTSSECYLSSTDEDHQNLTISQQRTRTSRRNKQKTIQGYYGGISGGVFLSPDPLGGRVDLNTGYGGSVFGGVKFPKNLSAEAEFIFALGGIDSSDEISGVEFDGDYNTFGLMINGRYDIPVSEKGGFKLFVSPGIGLVRASQNIEVSNDDFPEFGTLSSADISTTTFGFQLKAGASIPFGEKLQGFAQGRYMTNGLSTLSLEGGISYNF